MHIMPDSSTSALDTGAMAMEWLRFFEHEAPLVYLCVLHSVDAAGLALRMEHTHCFSPDTEGEGGGGHYQGNVMTAGVEEYEGWFNGAEALYHVDRPVGS